MQIFVNGPPQEVPPQTTIAQLIESLNLPARYLAVERNLELVPRGEHSRSLLQADDRLEIVTLVGGG